MSATGIDAYFATLLVAMSSFFMHIISGYVYIVLGGGLRPRLLSYLLVSLGFALYSYGAYAVWNMNSNIRATVYVTLLILTYVLVWLIDKPMRHKLDSK